MFTFAALLFGLGLCLLVVSGIAVLLRWGEARQRRILERTPLVPFADWRPGRRRMAAAGMVTAGPAGLVVSPVTGTTCAWYAVDLVRDPSRRYDDSATSVDHLWAQEAPGPPALQDHTGQLLLDPRLLRRQSTDGDPPITTTTVRRYRRDDENLVPAIVPRDTFVGTRKHETLVLTELVVPAGRLVYAVGSARTDGGYTVLAASRRGPVTVLTTDTGEQVHHRRINAMADSRMMARAFSLTGLAVILVAGLLMWLVWPDG
ncbi:hypothetical protein [Micromonospora sp. NBC_01796]|uniref:hypothetical protein n=1 Tax=Micromonospora sp. NBC_01796 TaxID=2975987 RepID=UPI002DDAAC62|nr:hypothetical protein [Micromonospora sp. NBC_01796]WSA82998.1 hypothetical protein OIE47_21465 [Micromonospora sp. NBC_01796]